MRVEKTVAGAASAWREFVGSSDAHRISVLSRGHIHQTCVVTAEGRPFAILQKLNQTVFPDPQALLANAETIAPHLARTASDLIAPRIGTHTGRACVRDAHGHCWRAFRFIAPSRNPESPECEAECRAAGQAFGRFQAALVDLCASDLQVVIRGFQDVDAIRCTLEQAILEDARGRLAGSRRLAEDMCGLGEQVPPLSGPCGVVHGDGKFNNLLFHAREARVIAVLDLDTVMWHRRALDFADLVRSGAVRGAEHDEQALLDCGRVRAFAAGFRAGCGELTPAAGSLVDALLHITWLLAMRFYADYLNGDVYFAAHAPTDNLLRARGQRALLGRLFEARDELYEAVACGLDGE